MAKGDTLTLLALAGVGAATGGLALPALAASGAATAAAGGAAAAGAASTAAATTSAFSLAGALSGAGAFLSAGSSYFAGQAQARAAKIQEGQMQLNLTAEQTQFALEEEDRQRRLRGMLSTQAAIFGASNISTSGVGDVIARDTIGTVNRETDLKGTLSRINQSQIRSGIAEQQLAGSAARTGGIIKAGSSLLTFAGQSYDRTRT